MIIRKEFTMLNGGAQSITDPSLAFSRLLVVNREGINYNMVTGSAVNREFLHDAAAGKIIFPIKPTAGNETVIVKIKL